MRFKKKCIARGHVAQAEGRRGMKPMKFATAVLATAMARNPASTMDVAWLEIRWCIDRPP